jgi:hypothetical protein
MLTYRSVRKCARLYTRVNALLRCTCDLGFQLPFIVFLRREISLLIMRTRLERIVPSLADIRESFGSIPVLSWTRLLRETAKSRSSAIFGHLVALPFQEKMRKSLQKSSVSEQDARDIIRTRMTTFFHKLRIHHAHVRDITLLCGWWRLDAHDSPEYNDMQPKGDLLQKPVPITHSDEFLRRTRTFDVSESSSWIEQGTDAISFTHARKLFDQECTMCEKYASLQSRTMTKPPHTKTERLRERKVLIGMNEAELRKRVESYMMEVEAESKRKHIEKAEQTAKDTALLL